MHVGEQKPQTNVGGREETPEKRDPLCCGLSFPHPENSSSDRTRFELPFHTKGHTPVKNQCAIKDHVNRGNQGKLDVGKDGFYNDFDQNKSDIKQ